MKKIIALVVMGVIIVIYALSVGSAGDKEKEVVRNESNVVQRLEAIEEQIEEKYPANPEEVIKLCSELLKVGYDKEEIQEETLLAYIQTTRKLYSQALKDMNAEENQLEALRSERALNGEKQLVLISDEILRTTITKGNNETEESANVEVKYSTNQGAILKDYYLIKEDDKWKIQSWETQVSEEENVEE